MDRPIPRATVIRPATADDAAAIAGLLGELGYPSTAAAIPGRLARMLSEPGQSALVAVEGDEVVGLATVIVRHVIHSDAPFARLAALVVRDGMRRRGVGSALAEAAEGIARKAGCSVIEITSGDHRRAAHDFYRRLGFEEKPRRFVKRLRR
jgi:GNAT superfamily N-acetyltransferase